MKRLLLTPLFAFVLAVASLYAQHPDSPNGIGVRFNLINFAFPNLDQSDNPFDFNDYTYGGEIEYTRSLNNALNISFPLKVGIADLPDSDTSAMADVLVGSLDALLHLKFCKPDAFFYPALHAGVGVMTEEFDAFNVEFPVGGSLNFRITDNVYFSTKAEYRFDLTDRRDNIVVGAGGLFLFGGAKQPEEPEIGDSDGDGVLDNVDDCKNIAGPIEFNGCPDTDGDRVSDQFDDCPQTPGLESLNGCPDADGDGITDADDACPNAAGPASQNGCPDADGDGIMDSEDRCPNLAGATSANGCPDRDGDGVEDSADDCPDQAGAFAAAGCPDADGDGIQDNLDKCPNAAGNADKDGCPEISAEDQEILDLAVQAIEFESGSSSLTSESYITLDQIVDILKRYQGYSCKIEGHTDSIGHRADNMKMSEDRAQACLDYLVSKGIDSSRLSIEGFGESMPIATNKYKDGRAQNRRVEFKLTLN
jgi:OOP family OmpA-OmpF porin